jgi:CHAT domain-containing protein
MRPADPRSVLLLVSFCCGLALAPAAARAADAGVEREAAQSMADGEGALKAGRNDEAVALLERAAQLFESSQGATGLATLAALNKLALAQSAAGQAAASLATHERILEVATEAFGELHPSTLTAMSNVASGRLALGRARDALPLALRAMALRDEMLGPQHPETLQSVAQCAAVRGALGDFAGALALDQQALDGRRAVLGEKHPDTLRSLNYLAEDLVSLGRYAEALPLHERAYALRREVLGERDPKTLESLNNLTATYEYLGRGDDALALHRQLVAAYTAVLGEQHPDTLTSMSNYAQALTKAGRGSESIALLERVLKVRSETLGADHPATLASRAAIASALFALGRYDAALPYAETVHTAYGRLFGAEHPDTVRAQDNLATLYLYLGKAQLALPLWEAALARYGELLGELHPSTIGVMPNLAQLYYASGKRAEGLALYERMLAAVEKLRATGDLSPENRQALFARWVAAYKNYVQVLLVEGRVERAFEVAELSKARTLLESSAVRRANQSGVLDPEEAAAVQSLELRIAALGDKVAAAFDRPDDKLQLESEKNGLIQQLGELRRKLTQKYPKYASLTDVKLLGPAAAKQLVAADAAFISYLTLGDSVVGFVVDSSGKTSGRVLGNVPDLARTVEAYRLMISNAEGAAALAASGKRVWRLPTGAYAVGPSSPVKGAVWVKDPDELAKMLGEKLIAPLRPQLAGKRHWIVSPEGALTLLPFETLLDEGSRVVIDHDISYAQSLSMLGLLRAREQDYAKLGGRRELFAVGGARYGSEAPLDPAAGQVRGGPSAVEQAFAQMRIEWDELPGSEREVAAIAALFPPEQVVVLTGDAASEYELAERNGTRELAQFKFLLFSTHGYLSTVEPALSAVVLSQVGRRGDTDGYVTASEWTRYDLQSDLIVLSACETGVGRVVQGEGVTGLPFALYVAGNRNTLLSLWPVVDESTALFMAEFFRRLRAGESQVQALNSVKRGFLSDPERRFVAPLFWAPFVLYGG